MQSHFFDNINPPPFYDMDKFSTKDKFPQVVIPDFPDSLGNNQFSISSGFDHIADIYLSANLGCQIQVQFKIKAQAITQSRVKEKCNHVAAQNSFEKDFCDNINKFNSKDGFGFVFGLFNMLNSGEAISKPFTPDIPNNIISSSANQACQCLAQQLSSLPQEKLQISGAVQVKGVSRKPSIGKVFVKIMTVRGKDKDGNMIEKKMVSSEGGQIEDSEGNKTGVQLNIIQL